MRKKVLGMLIIALSAGIAGILTITNALFSSSVRISQGSGSAGVVKKSIYLCPNIWEVNDPLYTMYVWDSTSVSNGTASVSATLEPSKTVSITVSNIAMECYVFEFDATIYDTFLFLRLNPGNSNKWNQTDDITYSSNYNVYRIISWDNNLTYHNSGYNNYLF